MTRTLAFVRSIEVAQAAPFLAQCVEMLASESIESRIYYTDGTCTSADLPAPSRKLDPKVTAEEIWHTLAKDSVQNGVSLSIPDENAVRDGFVKAHVEANGGRFVACSSEVARIFANKWETKPMLEKHGFTVPPSIFVDGDLLNGRGPHYIEYHNVVREQVRRIGYPVLIKPLWDCLGNGVVYIADEDMLGLFLASPAPGNVLVERCVSGTLCSVEVLCQDGRVFIQPIVWKGPAGGQPSFAFTQFRHTETPVNLPGLCELQEAITSLCRESGIEGALEFEFVYDGVFNCIEVNSRVSGSTGISIAACGVNTYFELARMALGRWQPPDLSRMDRLVALQFPIKSPIVPVDLCTYAIVHRWNTFTVEGEKYRNALVSVTRPRWQKFQQWCMATASENGPITPDIAREICAVEPR